MWGSDASNVWIAGNFGTLLLDPENITIGGSYTRLQARYTSDAVVDEILKSADAVVLTGEKREATMLFAGFLW